jgi:hypothetical protein
MSRSKDGAEFINLQKLVLSNGNDLNVRGEPAQMNLV